MGGEIYPFVFFFSALKVLRLKSKIYISALLEAQGLYFGSGFNIKEAICATK